MIAIDVTAPREILLVKHAMPVVDPTKPPAEWPLSVPGRRRTLALAASLRERGIARAILSNGEPDMLAEAVGSAGIADLLDDVLSVEAVGVFKPDPRVYHIAVDRFGLPPAAIGFFSSNPWDAFGALACGFRVFWVNRAGQPDEYGLRGRVAELADLSAVHSAIA